MVYLQVEEIQSVFSGPKSIDRQFCAPHTEPFVLQPLISVGGSPKIPHYSLKIYVQRSAICEVVAESRATACGRHGGVRRHDALGFRVYFRVCLSPTRVHTVHSETDATQTTTPSERVRHCVYSNSKTFDLTTSVALRLRQGAKPYETSHRRQTMQRQTNYTRV